MSVQRKQKILYTIGFAVFVCALLVGTQFLSNKPSHLQGSIVRYPDVAIHTQQSGAWQDPQTWAGGAVPSPQDNVVIEHQVTVAGEANAKHVDVLPAATGKEGKLIVSGGNLHLYDGSLVVWGTLEGTTGQILFHVTNDRLFASNSVPNPDLDNKDFYRDDYGLWGMPGSTVALEGPEVTSWLDAVPKSDQGAAMPYGAIGLPTIGNGSAVLASAPIGWQAGDKLVLTSLEGTHAIVTLTAVNGTTITYDDPSNFVAYTVRAKGRDVRPKIGNLTRRLVIAAANVREGDTNHRSHTNFFQNSTVNLKNVELRDLGPRQKLGRYPVHFHHMMDTTAQLIGSSIWQDVSEVGSRFVAIHNTKGVLVDKNVAVGSQGHGFFMEDGREINNTLTNNLSVFVLSGEELPVTNPRNVRGSHHFWTRAGNVVDNNVAVGPTQSSVAGRTYLNASGNAVPVQTDNTVGLVMLQNLINKSQSAEVKNFQALGVQKYGMWTQEAPTTFIDPIGTYSGQSAVAAVPTFDFITSPTRVVNPTFFFNGTATGDTPNVASPYHSQVFISLGPTVVEGGIFVGDIGMHVHYSGDFTVDGTQVEGKYLIHPTYYDLLGTIKNSAIHVENPIQSTYPLRFYSPGLLYLENNTGVVAGQTYTASTPYQGYLTLNIDQWFPGIPSQFAVNGSKWITTENLPVAGYLYRPPKFTKKNWDGSIDYFGRLASGLELIMQPVGTATIPMNVSRAIGESVGNWLNGMSTIYKGYRGGYAPGTYTVIYRCNTQYTSTTCPEGMVHGDTIRYENVPIQSGKATKLNDDGTWEIVEASAMQNLVPASSSKASAAASSSSSKSSAASSAATATTSSQSPQGPLGVVATWNFDGTPGTTVPEAGGKGFNFTLYNNPTWTDGAVTFNGTNQYGKYAGRVATGTQGTFVARVKPQGPGVVYAEGSDSQFLKRFGFSEYNGKLYLTQWDRGSTPSFYVLTLIGDTTPITPGQEYTIVVSNDGAKSTLYVNGVKQNIKILSGTATTPSPWFGGMPLQSKVETDIGYGYRWGAKEGYFNGSIDEITLYDRQVTCSEVQDMSNVVITGDCSTAISVAPLNLVAKWDFDGTPGTTVTDSSGKGFAMNLYGNPSWADGTLTLNGTNQYGKYVGRVATGTQGAFVARVKAQGAGGFILAEGSNSNNLKRFGFTSQQSKLYFTESNRGSISGLVQYGNTAITPGEWYTVIVSNENNVSTLYVNGIKQSLTALSGKLTDPSPWFGSIPVVAGLETDIGRGYRWGAQEGFYNGTIDDVRLYDRPISCREAQKLSGIAVTGNCG